MSGGEHRPTLTVIAGPHGAGKTSLYQEELSKLALKPGELVAGDNRDRVAALLADKKSFAVETTMTSRADVDLVRQAKAAGFDVQLHHVSVADADQAQRRVQARANDGGDRRPEQAVRDSYENGQTNIRDASALANKTFVYDNAKLDAPLRLAIQLQDGQTARVANPPLWSQLLYSAELKRVQENPAPAAAAFVATLEFSLAQHGRQSDHSAVNSDRAQFEGTIIGRTATHTIQETSPNNTVMHDNRRLDKVPNIGDSVLVDYEGSGQTKTLQRVDTTRSGGKLEYEAYRPTPPREGEATPMSRALAESLRRDPPQEALKKFPELTRAFTLMVAAQKQLGGDDQVNRTKVLTALRGKLADQIEHNRPLPSPTANKTIERSAEHSR